MLFFANDYGFGAHEAVLKALCETNGTAMVGYGEDPYSLRAAEKIRAFVGASDASVVFISGGTQVNAVAINALLQPYEAALCADMGHIYVHEAGAIEATGHKVQAIPGENGKMSAQSLRDHLAGFYAEEAHEHCPLPGLVYLSFPLETGLLYSLRELESIREVCDEYHLKMYIDGARMAYGLGCALNDVKPQDLSRLCDAFTLGGTKCGALCGEALVFPAHTPDHLVNRVKRQGALMAKGRLCGVQFDALFTDDLYMRIGRETHEKTQALRSALMEKGYRYLFDSPTNQQFVIMSAETFEELKARDIMASAWEKLPDGQIGVRFCTSFATRFEEIEALRKLLPRA